MRIARDIKEAARDLVPLAVFALLGWLIYLTVGAIVDAERQMCGGRVSCPDIGGYIGVLALLAASGALGWAILAGWLMRDRGPESRK
jgi:hypothetical protein